MQHHTLRPRQALNKAYLRLKTSRSDIEQFKTGLRTLLGSLNLDESEEHGSGHGKHPTTCSRDHGDS